MNKSKKFLATVLATLTALSCGSTLVGCGGNGDGGAVNPIFAPTINIPASGYDGSKQTVTFYHTMGQNLQEVLGRYIEKFNKQFPNITVVATQEGGYDDVRDKITTEISAKKTPNMAYCYPDHVALYASGAAVLTLDDLINSQVPVTYTLANGTQKTETLGFTQAQIDDFIPGYYNEGAAFGNDKMYMLPFSKSTEVLFYNKTFFEEHELSLPETWEDMEELLYDIKAIDPTCVPLGYDSESNWFITMCQQQNSPYTASKDVAVKRDHFTYNVEDNWEFVEKFRNWYKEELVTTQELYGSYTSKLFTGGDANMRSYMCIGSSAGASKQCPTPNDKGEFPFEVGITTIPQVDPDHPKVISQGPSICMFDKGAGKEQEMIATWLFMKYITTSGAFQAEFSYASGYVPVLQSTINNPVYADHLDKANGWSNNGVTAMSAKVCMDQAQAYFVSPAFYGSSVARDQVGALLRACFSGNPKSGQSVRDFVKDQFAQSITKCVDKVTG